MQKTDAVDLIRRPSLELCTFVCSACKFAFTLGTPLPPGGVACARCGEHVGVGDRVEYAAVSARLGALVLDALAALAPYFFLALVFMLFGDVIARDDEGNTTSGAKLVLWTVASVVFGIYFLISQVLGQSFGKRAMGLRVVRVSAWSQPGIVAGSVRALATLLTVATLGLGYAMMLFDSERRTLHDRIAGTRVIER